MTNRYAFIFRKGVAGVRLDCQFIDGSLFWEPYLFLTVHDEEMIRGSWCL